MKIVSKHSLNVYLISALFDSIGKHIFQDKLDNTTVSVIPYLLLIFCFSFVCSLITSCLYVTMRRNICRLVNVK